jgi:hypothetical protein
MDKGNQPGDNNIGKSVEKGDQLAELQKDSRPDVKIGNVDATRTAAEALNGPRSTWTSTSDASFHEKTAEIAKKSPEEIQAHMEANTKGAEAMQKHIASLAKQIEQVFARKNAQEALEAANRVSVG